MIPASSWSRPHAQSFVFVFHIWNEKYRAAIAAEMAAAVEIVDVDVIGDMRLFRNSIIHNKGIAAPDVAKCRTIVRFKPGAPINLNNREIEFIIRELRSQVSKYA